MTEKEADIQKDVQQKEKELGHLRSQLIPLKHEITNRNNVVMLYKSEIEKIQKEVTYIDVIYLIFLHNERKCFICFSFS